MRYRSPKAHNGVCVLWPQRQGTPGCVALQVMAERNTVPRGLPWERTAVMPGRGQLGTVAPAGATNTCRKSTSDIWNSVYGPCMAPKYWRSQLLMPLSTPARACQTHKCTSILIIHLHYTRCAPLQVRVQLRHTHPRQQRYNVHARHGHTA